MTVDCHELADQGTHFVDGGWLAASSAGHDQVRNPATGELLGQLPRAGEAEVNAAVAAARRAFPGWSSRPAEERLAAVRGWLELIAADSDLLEELLCTEVGTPVKACRPLQIGVALAVAQSAVEAFAGLELEERVGPSLIRHLPVGVVGAITPWNVPMILALQKIVPALLVGCTVVHKPSELTPLHAVHLARLVERSDLPAGVLNLVFGNGAGTGAALAASPGIDLISFTGSVRAGRLVAAAAAGHIAGAHLELGGKAASIVLDDADLPTAVAATVDQALFNSGQACLQWGRLVVPRARLAETEALVRDIVPGYVLGEPSAEKTDIGPLITSAAKQRVLAAIERAHADGARTVVGGEPVPAEFEAGNYVTPIVLTDVGEHTAAAREAIFGPVLCLLPHDGDEDAARVANATDYGLHGAVWSAETERAAAVASRIRTGQVQINGAGFNPAAPFGGFKNSGFGRECGAHGLLAFTATQSLQFPPSPGETGDAPLRQVGSRGQAAG
jgi:aldehyde dehydrogenase (NAD+)/betaine-aldehyde dehydrogenase